ncbi:MAG: DUF4129 domain-containing protein, partial [Caldilineaceae bacterium]
IVLVAFIGRFEPALPSLYTGGLVLLASVAAVVGALSTTVLAQPALRLSRTSTLRLAELSLFLVATRFLVWLTAGGFPPVWQIVREPFSSLFDPLFLVSAFVVTFAWLTAAEVTDDLNQLGLGSDELYVAEQRSDRTGDPMRSSGIDRRSVLTAFAMRWVSLGLLLILLSAALRQEMNLGGFFAILRQSIEPGVMTALIVYFLAGLLLLSHGQLAMLRARWTLDRLPTDATVTRRWAPLVVALVAGAALLALLMPFGGTFLLATVLSTIIAALFVAVLTIYRLLLFGILWLISIFGGTPPPLPPQAVAAPPPTLPQAAPPALVDMPAWLGAGFFYGILVLLVIYALTIYLGDRDVRLGWLTWLIAAFRKRWDEWRGLMRQAQRRFNRAGTGIGENGTQNAPFRLRLPLRGDPDAQVRALYLAALQDAADVGLPRERAETPLDFAPRLEESLIGEPQSRDAVRSLTDAFVDVRYAGRHTSADQARTLQEKWRALTQALRRHKIAAPSPHSVAQEDHHPPAARR